MLFGPSSAFVFLLASYVVGRLFAAPTDDVFGDIRRGQQQQQQQQQLKEQQQKQLRSKSNDVDRRQDKTSAVRDLAELLNDVADVKIAKKGHDEARIHLKSIDDTHASQRQHIIPGVLEIQPYPSDSSWQWISNNIENDEYEPPKLNHDDNKISHFWHGDKNADDYAANDKDDDDDYDDDDDDKNGSGSGSGSGARP